MDNGEFSLIKDLMESCPSLEEMRIGDWIDPLMRKMESQNSVESNFATMILNSMIQTSDPQMIDSLKAKEIWKSLEKFSRLENSLMKTHVLTLISSLSIGNLQHSAKMAKSGF